MTTKTTSTFAATTCSTDSKPAALRTNAVRRGSTASTVAPLGLRVAAEGDPVADGGQVGARGGPVAQAAGHVGPDLFALGEQDKGAAVLDRDPAGREAGLGVRLERVGERRAPAQLCKAHW